MVTLTIDGRQIQAEAGSTVMEAAGAHNIYIPSLCHHEAVTPYGACRLCLVEVETKGRRRVVTSCIYLVAEGMVVRTATDEIIEARQVIVELLLSRCPDSDVIQDLARKLGVLKSSFPKERGNNKCILCALCVRTCQEVVGASAISFVNRGVDREMAIPFYEDSEACIACGSCAFVCPTHAIQMKDTGGKRVITQPHDRMEFKLKKCSVCGDYWAPEKQLDYFVAKYNLDPHIFDTCPYCRD